MYGGRSTPYKNVRFGYSIYFTMKQLKSTFNFSIQIADRISTGKSDMAIV